MIIFDQLNISDNGKKLYVNAHVNKASIFDNVYIDRITIITADKVSETNPGTPTEDYIFTKKIEGKEKEINMVFTSADFIKTWEEDVNAMAFNQEDMSKTLFFIYITCRLEGSMEATIPCMLDEETTLGVTFDENLLHQKVMDYTKELTKDCCEIPLSFIDFILLWNAFKSSVETEHYISAIKFYNLLFGTSVGDNGRILPVGGCGCHG